MSCRWITPQAAGSSSHTRGTLINVVNGCALIGDHPRIRGEHHDLLPELGAGAGIIPAYAGNTSAPRLPDAVSLGSSPHTRGTQVRTQTLTLSGGDHPRIRGEHLPLRSLLLGEIGIIPAYAGNTSSPYRLSTAWTGSSPHTRGTRRWSARLRLRCWDHPRIRGEHLRVGLPLGGGVGIIPAYAGNTVQFLKGPPLNVGSSPHTRGTPTMRPSTRVTAQDHPRIRGEHRDRGTQGQVGRGIIPAYAGNTSAAPCLAESQRGSSPHTRGTPIS